MWSADEVNVLSNDKYNQVIALGRLGWSLREIEEATGVRREKASAYLKTAGIPVRAPRARLAPGTSKPASPGEVSTDSSGERTSKPASPEGVSTDPEPARQGRAPAASACEPYRELIRVRVPVSRSYTPIWYWGKIALYCQEPFRWAYQTYRGSGPNAGPMIRSPPGPWVISRPRPPFTW